MGWFAETVTIRPLDRGDRHAVSAVFDGLSDRSRRLRFLSPTPSLTGRQLELLVDVGCCGREAVVATERESGRAIGIAHYVRDDAEPQIAEVAFAVVDAWQGQGIGSQLARRLADAARADGITRFRASIDAENRASLALLRRLGPLEGVEREGATIELTIALEQPSARAA